MRWRRVRSWRFWILIGVTIIDGAFFIIPVVPLTMVLSVLIAPDLLRRTARFLDALADGR